MTLVAQMPHGPAPFLVVDLNDEIVTADFNHALAGKSLTFSVEIVELREATEEEIDHGHAHGPGGVDTETKASLDEVPRFHEAMGKERKSDWRTLSGLPLPMTGHPDDSNTSLPAPGEAPLHARHSRHDVPVPSLDHATVCRIFQC